MDKNLHAFNYYIFFSLMIVVIKAETSSHYIRNTAVLDRLFKVVMKNNVTPIGYI
jgi:hypothetical protein